MLPVISSLFPAAWREAGSYRRSYRSQHRAAAQLLGSWVLKDPNSDNNPSFCAGRFQHNPFSIKPGQGVPATEQIKPWASPCSCSGAGLPVTDLQRGGWCQGGSTTRCGFSTVWYWQILESRGRSSTASARRQNDTNGLWRKGTLFPESESFQDLSVKWDEVQPICGWEISSNTCELLAAVVCCQRLRDPGLIFYCSLFCQLFPELSIRG